LIVARIPAEWTDLSEHYQMAGNNLPNPTVLDCAFPRTKDGPFWLRFHMANVVLPDKETVWNGKDGEIVLWCRPPHERRRLCAEFEVSTQHPLGPPQVKPPTVQYNIRTDTGGVTFTHHGYAALLVAAAQNPGDYLKVYLTCKATGWAFHKVSVWDL
jgi:hypothetical protein